MPGKRREPSERRVRRTFGQHRSTRSRRPAARDDEERLTSDGVEHVTLARLVIQFRRES